MIMFFVEKWLLLVTIVNEGKDIYYSSQEVTHS